MINIKTLSAIYFMVVNGVTFDIKRFDTFP